MNVSVDPNSGFCFGVVFAIHVAEDELNNPDKLYCLGDIVHNNREVERLAHKGLIIINHEELSKIKNAKVLIRAHGEPPETYKIALENNLELIDASCPVVLKLQSKIRAGFEEMEKKDGQIVIYGKERHAEVNGLVGQTMEKAIIVNDIKDLDKIDFLKPVRFYSQTTQPITGFAEMTKEIEEKFRQAGNQNPDFTPFNTICSQVSHKEPRLKKFAKEHDIILFVSGQKSSNGLFLYRVCKSINPRTYFISAKEDIQKGWFRDANNVGICGATSTPMWLMEEIAEMVQTF